MQHSEINTTEQLHLNNKTRQMFLHDEFPNGLQRLVAKPIISAIGTIATSAIKNPLLIESLKEGGIKIDKFQVFPNARALQKNHTWTLALILSPYKRNVAKICQEITPSALKTGVIDTLLRSQKGIIGINTNAYAAGWAVKHFMNGQSPARVLIAGTGASSRSVIKGIHLFFPKTKIGVVGRSSDKAKEVVYEVGIGSVVDKPDIFSPDLVINGTTVGQTDDQESIDIDLESVFYPGIRYFDLNNRLSNLQKTALAKGCIVMSGIVMQILTNKLRVAILQRS